MLLTVNELAKAGGRERPETGTESAGGGVLPEDRKYVLQKSYRKPEKSPTLLPIKSSSTGATGPLQQFRPKWLCDGLTANPNIIQHCV